MWWYTQGILVLWVINPEIRRVYDLFFGFSQVEILAVLPLLSLVPLVWSVTVNGGWRRIPRAVAIPAWIWFGAFSYGLLTAVLSNNAVAGIYEFITFIFPLAVGLWVAADTAVPAVAYKRLTRTIFILATVTSLYGIIQYVVAPPWDVNWLKEVIKAGTTSFGQPLPFQIRVFSTSNDPFSFALILAVALLLVLPELSIRKPILLLQMPIWLIAFALTLVRTGWIVFAIGTVVYLVLAPKRASFIATFGAAACLIFAFITLLPAVTGNDNVLTSLNTRFATLSNLDEDTSGQARQDLYSIAPLIILGAPFGTGLGVLGGSTRLGSSGVTTDFDSGYLGRSLEMGIPGLSLYLVPQILLLLSAFRLWIRAQEEGDQILQSLSALAIAESCAFVFLQFGHDINGFPTLAFWLIECLAIRTLQTQTHSRARVSFAR